MYYGQILHILRVFFWKKMAAIKILGQHWMLFILKVDLWVRDVKMIKSMEMVWMGVVGENLLVIGCKLFWRRILTQYLQDVCKNKNNSESIKIVSTRFVDLLFFSSCWTVKRLCLERKNLITASINIMKDHERIYDNLEH